MSCAWVVDFAAVSQVSLAAQRQWLECVAATAASSEEGSDSLSSIKDENNEERLYHQESVFCCCAGSKFLGIHLTQSAVGEVCCCR